MAERKTSKKIAARERVREIRARLDAEKAERECQLYEVVTAFHEARVERNEALALAGRHEWRWRHDSASCSRWTNRWSEPRDCATSPSPRREACDAGG